MNKKFYIIILALTFCCFSCSKEKHSELNSDFHWQEIQIRNSEQTLIVERHSDSATLQNFIYKNKDGFDYELDTIEYHHLSFTNEEKDSLFKYVFDAIKNPLQIETSCTDYVGNITYEIAGDNYLFSYKYRSICEWNDISPESKKIYDLINTKVEFGYR